MQIDPSQAPEGATHYDKTNPIGEWVKFTGGIWLVYSEGAWYDCPMTSEAINKLVSIQSIQHYSTTETKVLYTGDEPVRGSDHAAGYDVRAKHRVSIAPGRSGQVVVNTRLQPPLGVAYLAMPRSSICKKNIMLQNSVGLIDNDYRGQTVWNFYNYGTETVVIEHGERIGQFVFFNPLEVQFEQCEQLDDTERGEGGFGSSGAQ